MPTECSEADVGGVSPLGAILSIATAITSVLAPLTAHASQPLCDLLGRRSPNSLRETMLDVGLAVDTFWSALSMPGRTGECLRHAGRNILIDIGIVVILEAGCTGALYAVPATVGDVLPLPQEIAQTAHRHLASYPIKRFVVVVLNGFVA